MRSSWNIWRAASPNHTEKRSNIMIFKEKMPDCVPEYYRSMEADEQHRYEIYKRKQEGFQRNKKKLEDAQKAGLPLLPYGGYDECWKCPHAEIDTATDEDDDTSVVICHRPDCKCHIEAKRKMEEHFQENQRKLDTAAEAGLPILTDAGYGICCWGCPSADDDTMTDDSENQPCRVICHNTECECHREITYVEMRKRFIAYESQTPPPKDHLTGHIVFTEGSFPGKKLSLKSRTYEVSSDNKAFHPMMGGYSLYGSALDGTDDDVRLERYMAEEQGGPTGWVVQYCRICERSDATCPELG